MYSHFHTAGRQTNARRCLTKFKCPGFVQPWLTRNCELKWIFQRLQARRRELGTTLVVYKLRSVTSGVWFQLCLKVLSQAVRFESLSGHRLNRVSLWFSSAPPVLCRQIASNCTTTGPGHIFPSLSSTNPDIWHCFGWDVDSVVQ